MEVRGISKEAKCVTLSSPIDFMGILKDLPVQGAVDERSLRLYRLESNGTEIEEPVQFTASPQPRPAKIKRLPGTEPKVSYLSEYAAGEIGEIPDGPRVSGELSWISRNPGPSAIYRMEFGILKEGRLIQVPYPPRNLRGFDAEGRATPVRWFPRMQIRPQWPLGGMVHILENHQLVTTYHTGPTHFIPPRPGGAIPSSPGSIRRPFFYPVNGPGGFSLTEFGKPHDPPGSHAHHYSLWIAHASVGGQDFWSERGGIIAHGEFEDLEDGPLFCRLVQKTRWIDETTEFLLETRTVRVYRAQETAQENFRLMDLELEYTPAGSSPVTLGKTTFGFLAVRVAQSMTVFDGGGEIINANGDRNEQGAHLKRAPWIDLSGPTSQETWSGIAVFDHPENPGHPTGWHCRNDGWAGASFNREREHTIEPGKKLRLRYRILLHEGDALRGKVALRFQEYCSTPTIHMGKAAKKS